MTSTKNRMRALALIAAGFLGSVVSSSLLLGLARDRLRLGCTYVASGEGRGYICGEGNGYFAAVAMVVVLVNLPVVVGFLLVLFRRRSTRVACAFLPALSCVPPVLLAGLLALAASLRSTDVMPQGAGATMLVLTALAGLSAVFLTAISTVVRPDRRRRLLLLGVALFALASVLEPGALISTLPSIFMLLAAVVLISHSPGEMEASKTHQRVASGL